MDEKMKKNVDMMIEARLGAFMKLTKKHLPASESAWMLLLKGHLLMEYILNHLIIFEKEGSAEVVERSGFAEKLKIIEDGKILTEKEILPIKRLNRIRNKLSHELEYQITEADVDFLGFCLGKEYIHQKTKLQDENSEETLLKKLLLFVLLTILTDTYTPILSQTIKEDIKRHDD